MPYLSLPNFNYDSGPRRIQSGPDHEGYVVLYSGVEATGADDGIVVAGTPIEGNATEGPWGYNSNWRYVPSTLQTQSGAVDPTPYNVSGALDTYDGVRIYTRNTVAGAQIASAIGPQPGSTVYRPEKYMYYGGAAPDNQNYSPYNTPEINLAAEGKTGGGVTHRTFESSLLTNVLGSQGTSDRSQWRYHQPVYCKTYTETKRSEVPGLMSTPLRAVYRGGSTSYSYNYGGELLASKGGFEPIYLENVPSPPLSVDVTPEPNGCYVITFSPPSNSGSCDVQSYEYSIDNRITWTALPSLSSPVKICGLGEVPFELYLRAVNCIGPGAPSPPQSNCVWDGTGISGSTFAGETLYAPVICPSGSVTWYSYDDSTNTSTVVSSGASLPLLNSYIDKRIYTIQSCPGGIGNCSSVYVSGVGPVTGFDTTQYNYARFVGTKTGGYRNAFALDGGEIGEFYPASGSWFLIGNSSASGCFLTIRFPSLSSPSVLRPLNPASSSILNPDAHAPWVANFDSWAVANANAFSFGGQCSTVTFRDGVFVNTLQTINASTSVVDGFLHSTVRGKWQFKLSSTAPSPSAPPDAEWIGVVDPAYFNSSASFWTPVTIPPYFRTSRT